MRDDCGFGTVLHQQPRSPYYTFTTKKKTAADGDRWKGEGTHGLLHGTKKGKAKTLNQWQREKGVCTLKGPSNRRGWTDCGHICRPFVEVRNA